MNHINTLHRSVLVTLALGAAFLFGAHTSANAQYTFFPNNTTINYALPHSADVAVIGEQNYSDWINGSGFTSPTINIVAGASLGGGAYVLDNSVVNMSGGFSQGFLASDSTTVNITGGTTVNVTTFWYATVNVYAGATITGSLAAQNGGTINVYGGRIGSSNTDAFAQGEYHTLNISGGTFVSNQIWVGGGATLNLYGSPAYFIGSFPYGPFHYIPAHVVTATLVNSNATFSHNGTMTSGWSEYELSGQLGDGTSVNGVYVFKANDGSTFTVNNPRL